MAASWEAARAWLVECGVVRPDQGTTLLDLASVLQNGSVLCWFRMAHESAAIISPIRAAAALSATQKSKIRMINNILPFSHYSCLFEL